VACSSAAGSGSSAGGGSSASPDKPFQIYAVAGETGAAAPVTPALLAGLKAAISTINAKGGILGRTVELTVANDQSDPTQAVSLVQAELAGGNKPDFVFGGTSSAEILAVSGVTNAAKIVTLAVGSSSVLGNAVKFPYTFSVDPTALAQAQSTVQYLKSKGYKNIGVIASDDATGNSYAAAYATAIEQAGLKVVDAESYPTTAVDMTPQLERINSKHHDAVVFEGVEWGAYLLHSREKAGMQNVPFVADAATQSVDYASAVTAAEKQGVVMEVYKMNANNTTTPGKTALLAALHKQGVNPALPLEVYALSSDMLLSYANAATAAHSTDPDKVKAELQSGDVPEAFPTALTTKFDWTAALHLTDANGYFEFIPVTGIVNGQYAAP
jgi:ABC-type branched-subunit amino acid transport system substrate-binding protein